MLLAAGFAGFMTGAGLIIAIGAQNAFVLRQGLQRSHVGLVVAVCIFGDVTLIFCGVAGVGALVHQWPALLQGLRFGGAAFLAWYGAMAAQRAWRGHHTLTPTQGNAGGWRRALLACLAFTFLNPHVYLDTVLLLGSLSGRFAGPARLAYGVGAAAASFVWFFGLGYGARLLQPFFARPAAWRNLDSVVGLVMAGIAVSLIARLFAQA